MLNYETSQEIQLGLTVMSPSKLFWETMHIVTAPDTFLKSNKSTLH